MIVWLLLFVFGNLLREIFSKRIKQNDQENEQNDYEPIPPVPRFEYRNFIVVHILLIPENTNCKSQKKVKNEPEIPGVDIDAFSDCFSGTKKWR